MGSAVLSKGTFGRNLGRPRLTVSHFEANEPEPALSLLTNHLRTANLRKKAKST